MRITPRRMLAAMAVAALSCTANDASTVPGLDARALAAVVPARVLGFEGARRLTTGCSLPEHRQFDFWVGTWDVYGPGHELAGVNIIEPRLDGCVVEENWTSGTRGRSINAYDASDGQWHQHWISADGGPVSVLLLDGASPAPDSMRMAGTRPALNGAAVEDAITWSATAPDSLRQHWLSTVGDRPPAVAFDGSYERVAEARTIPPVQQRTCIDRPANHALDFLLGRWTISLAEDGNTQVRQGAAMVTFSADLDHCLIEEKLEGPGTYRGWSFSGYQPVLGAWKKTWVDNLGQRILLTGGLLGDSIVLTGPKRTADGEIQVRVTYAPSGEGRVTQRWETSRDGGATWGTELEVRLVKAPD